MINGVFHKKEQGTVGQYLFAQTNSHRSQTRCVWPRNLFLTVSCLFSGPSRCCGSWGGLKGGVFSLDVLRNLHDKIAEIKQLSFWVLPNVCQQSRFYGLFKLSISAARNYADALQTCVRVNIKQNSLDQTHASAWVCVRNKKSSNQGSYHCPDMGSGILAFVLNNQNLCSTSRHLTEFNK